MVFGTYYGHNSSRKGFREKDPGYVGIRANKDLWRDLSSESNILLGVLFYYQRQKENVTDMARDASTRNPQSYLLVSCKLPKVFRKRLESVSAPNLEPTCMYVNHVTKTATNKQNIKKRTKRLVLFSRHHPFIPQAAQNNRLGGSEYADPLLRLFE